MAVNRSGSIQVRGLNELRRALKALDEKDSADWRKEMAKVNFEVAQLVVSKAKPRMSGLGGMGSRAAKTMTASRSGVTARLSLGGPTAPFAEGVEFGAYQDRRRIIKNTGARPTIVRADEDIDKVIGRVENQYIERGSRKTSSKAFAGRGDVMQVRAVRVVTGWNQFRPWRGNGMDAGYALYPTMRDSSEEILDLWVAGIDRLTQKAFPD